MQNFSCFVESLRHYKSQINLRSLSSVAKTHSMLITTLFTVAITIDNLDVFPQFPWHFWISPAVLCYYQQYLPVSVQFLLAALLETLTVPEYMDLLTLPVFPLIIAWVKSINWADVCLQTSSITAFTRSILTLFLFPLQGSTAEIKILASVYMSSRLSMAFSIWSLNFWLSIVSLDSFQYLKPQCKNDRV